MAYLAVTLFFMYMAFSTKPKMVAASAFIYLSTTRYAVLQLSHMRPHYLESNYSPKNDSCIFLRQMFGSSQYSSIE